MTPRPAALLALALAGPAVLAGCGADDDISPEAGPREVVTDDISVLDVVIEYPLDGAYEVGEDARLFVAITNTGTTDDELLEVTGEDFADAVLTTQAGAGAIPVPADSNVYVGAEGLPDIVLGDLRTDLRSSQSIPVTFVFAEGGEVTVDAVVAAEGQTPSPPFDFPDPDPDVQD